MSDHEDQPSNSTDQEVDHHHQEQEVGHGGRLYKCIFCKRGFTTAQALGGHMNIHRKDRAKGRPNDTISSKQENIHGGPRFYQPVFASYISETPSDREGQVRNYPTYFSSTSSIARPAKLNQENNQDIHGMITSSSSLRSHGKDQYLKTGNEEGEVDLELRLGHDP